MALGVLLFIPGTSSAAAQSLEDLARERADYMTWLASAPNSPLAAIAQQPVGTGLRLGPQDSDIPLAGVPDHRIVPRGQSVMLQTRSGMQALPIGSPLKVGRYTLYVRPSSAGLVATVFEKRSARPAPGFYEYDSTVVFTSKLFPPEKRDRVQVLTAEGLPTQATEAGSVLVGVGAPTRLRVRRIPVGGEDETELEIFFRDPTNGRGTYPAGRFVTLVPLPGGEYRIDFNRARNPFCAYSSVYPCPAPWQGNSLPGPVRAGERYDGGGLEVVPSDQENR
jgi:hypothetical protein